MKAPVSFETSGTRFPVTVLYAVRLNPQKMSCENQKSCNLFIQYNACGAVVDSKLAYKDL
jgi:hypothetical protein